jgi:methyl-accepting chemotaxis protein
MQTFRDASAGLKLSLASALFLLLGFAGLSLWLSNRAGSELRMASGERMAAQQKQTADMIGLFDRTLQHQASQFLNLFLTGMAPDFSLTPGERVDVAGRSTPVFRNGGEVLNGHYDAVDRFTHETNAPVTIFARDDKDFVRVTTSLKKADGSRAEGTLLDRHGASYAMLSAGKPYIGIASLFGTRYITKYQPIVGAGGDVIGASFIGINISQELAALGARIRAMGDGPSGYTMLVDDSGNVIAGGPYEGKSLTKLVSASGASIFSPLLKQTSGVLHYRPSGGDERARSTYYLAYPAWHWVIASTVVDSEIEAGIHQLRNQALIAGLLAALLLAGGLYLLQRRMITRPLARLADLGRSLAAGRLDQRMEYRNRDEIGQLVAAMNSIGSEFTDIVSRVRESVGRLVNGAATIARDTEQLSVRSEQAASSLEQTSASLEQITATVRNTADGANHAQTLTHETSSLADQGSDAMAASQQSMKAINDSSRQIGDILTLINDLAFKTNILALNASVEAARAGEHGRGFAVVASEVRALADRAARAGSDIQRLIDQSIANAQHGDKQVQNASTHMHDIKSSVERVTALIGEISVGTTEQSQGIEHINVAVSELETTTQQNASMVHESTRAAGIVREQAEELERLMSAFSLGNAATARNQPAPKPIEQTPASSSFAEAAAPTHIAPVTTQVQTTGDDEPEWRAF